jgi:drug/metabolite transporter (DMT)-like permease
VPGRCSASRNVAIKFLTHAQGPLHGLLSPWTLTVLIAGAISFYASARSLQVGPAVEVIALTSVAANLAAIIGGVLVFDEPIGSGAFEIGARFIAFCLVIAGAALMPGHPPSDAHRSTRRPSRMADPEPARHRSAPDCRLPAPVAASTSAHT